MTRKLQSSLGGLVISCLFLMTAMRTSANEIWPRPVIVPRPKTTLGVAEPVISLNGTWKFTLDPPEEFWRNDVDPSLWKDVTVPGEPWMQGLEIKRDVEYPFKKRIDVPADFKGKKILLRFDGVYSVGRVWVNGQLVGEHYGGFTSWNLDVTEQVTSGKPAWITVGIIDLTNDISFASGYASRYLGSDFDHFIGGILRDVTLLALPQDYVTRLHVETDFDDQYRHATLKVSTAVSFNDASSAQLELKLIDPAEKAVEIVPNVVDVTKAAPEGTVAIPVSAPEKWDAEHPNLYTLQASLLVNGSVVETLTKKVGFRELELKGSRFLVNGKEVKLRGGNRHSVHPLAGRAYVAELAERDVLLYKRANVNYIRTSHYPTSERFLEMADKYGLYIEEEMAIVWLDHGAARGKLNNLRDDPNYLPKFMSNISETLERDRSHPCIVIWSLGNENVKWGKNFQIERDYARLEDPSRPLKTGHNHYGGGWNTDQYTDLDSYHYPTWNSDFNKQGKPYLFDEYVHVLCYYGKDSTAEIDPNGRNFWGESIKRFWENMFPAQGALGAAIWGTIDDVFLSPNRANGYGRWGIIDGWRRKKPEHWLTKKAYSPIRIENRPLGNPGAGRSLQIPVKNWFDHTDFSELEITWNVGKDSSRVEMDLAPGEAGELVIPGRAWKPSDVVHLQFHSTHPSLPLLVDQFELPLEEKHVKFPDVTAPAPEVAETAKEIVISGKLFEIVFDKTTGSITRGTYRGELILTGGPQLNLSPLSLPPWAVDRISARAADNHAAVHLSGKHGAIGISYELRIDGTGLIETTYTIDNPPANSRAYDEVGISYFLTDKTDRLAWERKGLWSVYPQDHIGRNRGVALKIRPGPEWIYRAEPTWPWSLDMKDFLMRGKDHQGYGMTNDFRAAKEYIYYASAVNSTSGNMLRVESDGESHAVRMQKARRYNPRKVDDRDPTVTHHGNWSDYADPLDYLGTEKFSGTAGDTIEHTFTGTSIAWISVKNHNCGKADVYLDAVLVQADMDTYATSKQYQEILFQRSGLTDKGHTIKIVVKGTKNPKSLASYIISDGFSDVQSGVDRFELQININRDWAYELGWGNYNRASKISSGFGDTVRMRLTEANPRPR